MVTGAWSTLKDSYHLSGAKELYASWPGTTNNIDIVEDVKASVSSIFSNFTEASTSFKNIIGTAETGATVGVLSGAAFSLLTWGFIAYAGYKLLNSNLVKKL